MELHSNMYHEMSESLSSWENSGWLVHQSPLRERVAYAIFMCLQYHSFPFHCKRSNVLTAPWIWLIKCILLKSSFYKNAVIVKEQRRLVKSRLKQPKWTKALKCCKTYQTLSGGNRSVVQIRLCWCKHKMSVHCLHGNMTLADGKFSVLLLLAAHKHLRSVQEDHRALFSELHTKDSNHPICSMGAVSPCCWSEDQGEST